MLQPVEILPHARAAMRRAVRLPCELTTGSHGPRRQKLVDLSSRGARVVTDVPVRPGEHVLLGMAPVGLGRRVDTLARVAHVGRRSAGESAVGLEFVGLDPDLGNAIERGLRGTPPPLPARPVRRRRELVWVDMLVTWEEDLGDRVNVWEVAERMAGIDDGELIVETIAPLLTGGSGPHRWIH